MNIFFREDAIPVASSAAPELIQRAMSELFSNIKGVEIIIDNILSHAPTAKKHDTILVDVLQICGQKT